MAGAGFAESQDQQKEQRPAPPPPKRKGYQIDLEVYEARPDSWCHKKGDKFKYPADWGKLCPWLRASLNEFVRLLENGVTLPWRYEGTPYEKVIDPEGGRRIRRCPDPTRTSWSRSPGHASALDSPAPAERIDNP
jgi:uncharacterized repeat protein (TIGR04076 family)